MEKRGVQEGQQFATLTDIITNAWSGFTTREYKAYKGLHKENLRDNMTNTELILNMLAEASTKDITEATEPRTLAAHKAVARQGGTIARNARLELEARTGRKVVSPLNARHYLESQPNSPVPETDYPTSAAESSRPITCNDENE